MDRAGRNPGRARRRSRAGGASEVAPDAALDVAIALGYDMARDNAPKVLAKGADDVARRIVAVALENGVMVRKDANLAAVLGALEIDTEIPVEAFTAVAEILSYVYQANRTLSGRAGNGDQ